MGPSTPPKQKNLSKDRELCSQAFNSDVAGAFYGDLWAEALAIDIFSLFLEDEVPGGSSHDGRNVVNNLGDRFRPLNGVIPLINGLTGF